LSLLEFPRQPIVLPGHGWRPPDEGFVKINTDGLKSILMVQST
jgi:hypothetical protein